MKWVTYSPLLLGLCLPVASLAQDENGLPEMHVVKALEAPERLAFSECAAYFFLAARGHPGPLYDGFYSAGEFSLNAAVLLHGAQPANHAMEAASAKLMAEIKQDWQNIAQLVRSHAPPCEALLRDAEYLPPR
jgi:hypothetical protein